jgi:hypothetical protein
MYFMIITGLSASLTVATAVEVPPVMVLPKSRTCRVTASERPYVNIGFFDGPTRAGYCFHCRLSRILRHKLNVSLDHTNVNFRN